jgi:acyl carrier protein
MKEFIEAFEENLDLAPGSVSSDTDFKALAEWDSLAQLTVITIIEDIYRKVIDSSLLKNSSTIGELIANVEAL